MNGLKPHITVTVVLLFLVSPWKLEDEMKWTNIEKPQKANKDKLVAPLQRSLKLSGKWGGIFL